MAFYFILSDELIDEVDDQLEVYSEHIMRQWLSGEALPDSTDGTNNSYYIRKITSDELSLDKRVEYEYKNIYIAAKLEDEPARVMHTIFEHYDGTWWKLTVMTPIYERNEVISTILIATFILLIVMLLVIIGVFAWVFVRHTRPLYKVLRYLDSYAIGKPQPLNNRTDVTEFQQLNDSVTACIHRIEEVYERERRFIGDASHELQTPLAILGTRLEWLMNSGTLSEEQMTEIIKMQRSLSRLVRLNRTLLLLSKIENGQFPETTDVNIAAIIRENIEIYSEIYADREISCTLQLPDGFKVSMNESLATTLISNLLKNSFVHNSNGGCVKVSIEGNTLTVANSGNEPLDASRIFERFYHKGNSDSTGLGLPLVSSIAERYGTKVEYCFADGMHCFSIKFMR